MSPAATQYGGTSINIFYCQLLVFAVVCLEPHQSSKIIIHIFCTQSDIGAFDLIENGKRLRI